MTRDEITSFASIAGWPHDTLYRIEGTEEMRRLTRFAELVSAAAVAAERERCARIVFENAECCREGSELRWILLSNAAAIRAG